MKLRMTWLDMRGGSDSDFPFRTSVIDEDTGKTVGFIEHTRGPRKRHVSLFDGKYQGIMESPEECWGFVQGVEAVLNHITAVKGEKSSSDEAAA